MSQNISAVLNDVTSRSRVKQQLSRLAVGVDSSSTSSSSSSSTSSSSTLSPSSSDALSAYRSALTTSLAPAASERARASESGSDLSSLLGSAQVPLSALLADSVGSVSSAQRSCSESLDRVEDALSLSLSARAAQLWALLRRLHALHRTLLAVLPLLLALRTRLLDARTAHVLHAHTTQLLSTARTVHAHALQRLHEHEALEAACAAVEVLLQHSQHSEALRLLTERAHSLPELARVRAWRALATRVSTLRERCVLGLASELVRAVLGDALAEAQRCATSCVAAGEDALLALADATHSALLDSLSDTHVDSSSSSSPSPGLDSDALVALVRASLERLQRVQRGSEVLREAGAALRAQALLVASSERVVASLTATLRHDAPSALSASVSPELVAPLLAVLADLARSLEQWQAPRAASSVRSTALTLGRAYADTLHAHALQALASSLDAEPWVSTRVPSEYQRLFDALVSEGSSLTSSSSSVTSASPTDSLSSPDSLSLPLESESLRLPDGRSVSPCASALLLLKRVHVLVRCSALFSSAWRVVAADSARLVGELLHAFNARSFALVLRQGALQTGALKGVAVRHLAQVAAALDVLLALVRSLRSANVARFGSGVEARLLLEQYSQLLTHIEQHSQQLMDKFVELMVERAVAVAQRLLSVPLDTGGKLQGLGLDELEKKLLVLHKALHGTLSPFQTRAVLVRVLSAYRRVLRDALSNPSSPELAAAWDAPRKQRLCEEARALDLRASALLQLDAHEALALALLPVCEAAPLGATGTATSTTSAPPAPGGNALDGGLQAAQRLLSTLGWDSSGH